MLTGAPFFPKHDRKGEVAERLNAPVLKTGKVATPSRVRIPVSPPYYLTATYHNIPQTKALLVFLK